MKLLALTLLCVLPAALHAQTSDAGVSAVILHRDSLFWQAYNTCDTQAMRTFLTDDVEFYHDKGGATLGLSALMASIEKNLCADPERYHLRREAVAGSVHVFPLRKNGVVYGAVLSGRHEFYIVERGKDPYVDGLARFTHLWLLREGQWKMARILSYDHGPAPYVNTRREVLLPLGLLRKYAGKYKGPQSGVVEVTLPDSGRLVLGTGNDRMVLYPEAKDRFFSKERDLTFEFTADGKMIVREHGAVAETLARQ